MKFNRKLLATAVSGLLLSNTAFAVVNLDANSGAATFIKEIAADVTANLENGGAGADVLDFSAATGAASADETGSVFLRFSLTNASWDNTVPGGATSSLPVVPVTTPLTPPITAAAATVRGYISVIGSQTLLESVIVEVKNTGGGVTLDQVITVTGLKVKLDANTTANDVTITKTPYLNSDAAFGGVGAAAGAAVTADYVLFKSSLSVAPLGDLTKNLIDVRNNRVAFEVGAGSDAVSAAVANLCAVDVDFAVTLPDTLEANGNAIVTVTANPAIATSEFVFTGDFSAAAAVTLSSVSCAAVAKNGNAPNGVIDGDKQSVTFSYNDSRAASSDNNPLFLCMTVDGVTSIPVSKYEGTYTVNEAVGYNPIGPFNISCGETKSGGSTAVVPLILNGSAIWKNYIRITNPSNIDGKVFITAYNDAGVAGANQVTFDLKQGESTGIIDGNTIITTTGVDLNVTAPIDDLTAGSRNKARLVITAEFGKNDGETGVEVRTYSLASDATSFSQFD